MTPHLSAATNSYEFQSEMVRSWRITVWKTSQSSGHKLVTVVMQKHKSPRVHSWKMPAAVLNLILSPWEVTRPLNMKEDGDSQRCRLFGFHSRSCFPSSVPAVTREPAPGGAQRALALPTHTWAPRPALGRHREYREMQGCLMRMPRQTSR